ncbi:MAG: ThiF family adenylyltransferase [Candidatus Anstonellales archaeon]
MKFHIFERNIGAITESEQRKLCKSSVAIAGLGGLGSIAAEVLARAGIGNFLLFDPDKVEITNINRQIGATFETLGKPKAGVVKERILAINKWANVKAFSEPFRYVKADIYLECSDSAYQKAKNGRIIGSRMACYGAAGKGMGIVGLMKGKNIEKTFMLPSRGKRLSKHIFSKYRKCTSIFTGAAIITGAIQAQQAINFLLGKTSLKEGELLIVRPFSRKLTEVVKLGD